MAQLVFKRGIIVAVMLGIAVGPRTSFGTGALPGDSTSSDTGAVSRDRVGAQWSATGLSTFARFSSDRPVWHTEALLLRRHVHRRSTLDLEVGVLSRHGLHDTYAALDVYRTVGSRAYANVRFSAAPEAAVTARTDVHGELFVSPGSGWELSAGYRRADYARSGSNTWMVGAARYIGNWYIRVRPSATEVGGSVGFAVIGTARRYLGRPNEHVGLVVARGREIVVFPGEAGVEARDALAGSVFYQRDIGRKAGIRLGLEGVDDGDLSRWGFLTGILWRW